MHIVAISLLFPILILKADLTDPQRSPVIYPGCLRKTKERSASIIAFVRGFIDLYPRGYLPYYFKILPSQLPLRLFCIPKDKLEHTSVILVNAWY